MSYTMLSALYVIYVRDHKVFNSQTSVLYTVVYVFCQITCLWDMMIPMIIDSL